MGGWASEASTKDDVALMIDLIADACSDAGRDPSSLGYRATLPKPSGGVPPAEVPAAVDEIQLAVRTLAELGVDHFTLPLREWAVEPEAAVQLVAALTTS